MNSDVEILDDSGQGTNSLLDHLLNENSSDEEDIVCLDTVFKPSNEVWKSRPVKNDNMAMNSNSLIESQMKLNCFDKDEEIIDDMLPPPTQNTNLGVPSTSNTTYAPLYNVLYSESRDIPYGQNKNSAEPPKKKMKSKTATKKTVVKSQASLSPSTITSQTGLYNPKDCKYPMPAGSQMLDFIVLLLRNANCLLVSEIWDYVTGLFPYFEYHFTIEQGATKISRVLSKYQTYFLRTTSEIYKKNPNKNPNKKLVMLNPVTKSLQNLIIEKVFAKKELFLKALYVPEIFDSLIDGNVSLFDVELFHKRKPTSPPLKLDLQLESLFTSSNSEGHVAIRPQTLAGPVNGSLSTSSADPVNQPSSGLYVDSLKDVDLLDLIEEGDRADALSPKSSSSIDTIVFDPKIVNCRTLVDDEIEADLLAVNDLEDASSPNASETGFQSKLLIQLEDMPLHSQGIGSESAFANTVWSNELEITNTSTVDAGEDTNQIDDQQMEIDKSNVTRFPEIDKCVPKWKEIFPWMDYKRWHKKIYCMSCQKILRKLESNDSVVVVEVNHPDDVFKVSKQLRTHSDKLSHKMALILENKAIISTLYFLLNSHFNEFNSIKEILTTFEDLFPSSVNFNQDTLKCTIQMLGEYLEDKIISKLKKLKKFSVITDPCAGLLVVRFVNEDDEPEEHIISSYARVLDKTPCEYLNSLGVLTKFMIVCVTNARCEECQRCKGTKKVGYKNSTPLRLPSLDKYLVFLWRTKLLKPFYSIGSTLCKLWVGFPHKFTEIGKLISLEKLSKFPSNPDAFMDIFQNMEKFQEIAKDIYVLNGNLEALGFHTLDVSKYKWLLDVFPILTNINILFLEIKSVFPFYKDFDNLFHNAEKLKLFCEKAKDGLREKKIVTTGIDAADIDDLYNLVDLTVKEIQQPIYNKGRSVPLAYYRMTTLKNLNMYKTNTTIMNTFLVLYSAIKSNYRYERTSFLLSLTNFLAANPKCEKRDSVTVLNYFKKTSEPNTLTENMVYTFYRLMAYFPFQPAKNERCLYETKIYDYLFYRSAWSGIGPNIKDYLLTIIYELSGKQMLSEKDILGWWRDKVK